MTRTRPTPPAHPPAIDAVLVELEDACRHLAELRAWLAGQDPLVQLRRVHEASATVAIMRATFSDLKGLVAVEANNAGNSYPKIADALDCSEPYVQQMIYRGRKVGV